jgi:DNA-binding CsgD family transcriptional regulator
MLVQRDGPRHELGPSLGTMGPSDRGASANGLDRHRCELLVAQALRTTDARLTSLSLLRHGDSTVAPFAWEVRPAALWRRAHALAQAILPGFDLRDVRFPAAVNQHVRAVHIEGKLVDAAFADVAAGTTDPRVLAIAGSTLGLRHTLAAPIEVDGVVVGSLAFHGPHAPTGREHAAATGFAVAAALTLENERLIAALAGGGLTAALADDAQSLTLRQGQVAALIADGLTDRQIAAALSISRRTVTTHVSHILERLGCANRAQIADWVAQRGLADTYSSR